VLGVKAHRDGLLDSAVGGYPPVVEPDEGKDHPSVPFRLVPKLSNPSHRPVPSDGLVQNVTDRAIRDTDVDWHFQVPFHIWGLVKRRIAWKIIAVE
jgi:hypothetical protein